MNASRENAAARRDPSDEALGGALGFLRALWQVNHALESASRRMRREMGVTGPERLFIRLVGRRPGITPTELARILSIDRSTVTPLIQRLEARRIVRRRRNPSDARSFHLELTLAGARLDALRRGTIERSVEELIAATPPRDVGAAAAVLIALARRLEAPLRRRAPRGRR